MPRFSANISMLFQEHDFLDRFQAAKDAGFGAIEVQFPYDIEPKDLLAAKENAGVEIAVINIDAGDLTSGGPGLAAMPGRQDQFKEAVEQAHNYARILKLVNMNVLPGWPPMDQFSRDECLEYDLYHMQIMEGNLVNRMSEILDHIGHIQFADTPGRHEPGTGEINYPFVFKALDKMGWPGWLGAEYVPTSSTEESLGWLEPYI